MRLQLDKAPRSLPDSLPVQLLTISAIIGPVCRSMLWAKSGTAQMCPRLDRQVSGTNHHQCSETRRVRLPVLPSDVAAKIAMRSVQKTRVVFVMTSVFFTLTI